MSGASIREQVLGNKYQGAIIREQVSRGKYQGQVPGSKYQGARNINIFGKFCVHCKVMIL